MAEQVQVSHTMTFGQLIKDNIRNYSMFIMLVLILTVFALLTSGINLSSRNVSNIFMQNSYILTLAAGMVLVIIVGNIDLSVGSVAAFTGAIAVMLYNSGVALPITLVLTMLVGVGIGMFQGFWIAFMKIPAFIVTLSGMLLWRGFTYILTDVTPISLVDNGFRQVTSGFVSIESLTINDTHYFAWVFGAILALLYLLWSFQARRTKINRGFEIIPLSAFWLKNLIIITMIMLLSWKFADFRGVPIVVIVLAVVVGILTFITKRTVIGRYIYAVGGNSRSAKLSGINSEMVVFVVHVIMGSLAGLAGLVFAAYMNSAIPNAGQLFELDAIAACFIGGASASGGIGTIIGAIIGGLVMGVINNGMSLMNIGIDWQYVVKALVLLFAVFYDIYTRRKAGLA